ncbi:hypothetical protein [Thioalkalivibrio sp.]|uniref:hypothetical protein n=1 Tax=Thioalkalivibrio sp. TaxID=2093813 RepID=UPI00356440FE
MNEQATDRHAYFYEHVNGTIHRKPAIVVEMGGGPHEYFDSPNVKRWWREQEATTHPATRSESDGKH